VASPVPSGPRRVKKTGMVRRRCAFLPISCSIHGPGNRDPYADHAEAIAALGRHVGLRLDRGRCYPYGQRSIERELAGQAALDYAPGGFVCAIAVPLAPRAVPADTVAEAQDAAPVPGDRRPGQPRPLRRPRRGDRGPGPACRPAARPRRVKKTGMVRRRCAFLPISCSIHGPPAGGT
jgi:hypothetical protein